MPVIQQKHPEVETNPANTDATLEASLKAVWEKARAATELIAELRSERSSLVTQLDQLQQELRNLRSDLNTKEQELKRVRAEHLQLINANGKAALTEEEREILRGRIRDLITKINSYL